MKFEINNRWNGSVIFALETTSLKLCVEAAVKSKTDLRDSNLRDSNLRDSNLSGSNLSGSDLSGSDLRGSNLSGIQKARLSILPSDGDIIGWKQCLDSVIVKLLIPADAKRSNATGRKCRAEFADVLEVIGAKVGLSRIPSGGETIEYRKGERVKCATKFDECRWSECSTGIHFYITRIEAEND